ncbi:MAG: hypothetical protein Ct9H90mP7_2850 [Candidatus Neomarinimicrobiota bacterium]|nr:MAG: hypothetical protein Ct9H90mP7_2850 [Candidatus Neomarinimicrobiota bacterium]
MLYSNMAIKESNFSEITRSNPFKINKVINSADIPMDNPAMESILAVLKKPL